MYDFVNRHNMHGKPHVVRREIIRSETNTTRWYLNGKASSLKAVRFEFLFFLLLLFKNIHPSFIKNHSPYLIAYNFGKC